MLVAFKSLKQIVMYPITIKGSLEIELLTYGQMQHQWREQSEKRKNNQKRKSQNEDQCVRNGRKVTEHCVFPMSCFSDMSKNRLAKAAGAEPSGRVRDQKIVCGCGVKRIVRSKCQKHLSFGALLDNEASKTCTGYGGERISKSKMQGSEHFWQFRCSKSVRLCGAKNIAKSIC